MNFVRCEQCGAKALIAASQCPKCTHPLSLRDFRGDVVPLAHCHKCETYYRRSLGGCRWCGTKASGVALPRHVLLVGAAVVLAVVALGSWQWRAARARDAAATRTDSLAAGAVEGSAVSGEVAVATAPVLDADPARSVIDSLSAGDVDSAASQPASATFPAAPASPAPRASQTPGAPVATEGRTPQPGSSPPPVGQTRATPSVPGRYAGPWSPGLAREWVNVRASNSPEAEVVGVVTPNTRVQLGELRAGWRRVRSAGVEGWADARYFSSDSTAR